MCTLGVPKNPDAEREREREIYKKYNEINLESYRIWNIS